MQNVHASTLCDYVDRSDEMALKYANTYINNKIKNAKRNVYMKQTVIYVTGIPKKHFYS